MKKLTAVLLAVLCTVLCIAGLAETEMPPQFATTKSFVRVLEAGEIPYVFGGVTSTGEEHVYQEMQDEHFAYTIHLLFSRDEDLATIVVWDVITFEDADFLQVLRTVNRLNSDYKYTRFYVDESSSTVTCRLDVILHDEDDAGNIVLEGLQRMASILKSAYPQLAPCSRP